MRWGMRGELTRLEQAVVDAAGREDADASAARGFFVGGELTCDLDTMELLLVERAQLALYPDLYEAYDRTYTTDADAYFARQVPELLWEVQLTGILTILASSIFEERLTGGIRYVPEEAGGPALLAHTVMSEPAVWPDDEAKSFDQDDQLSAVWPAGDGSVVQIQAIWRQIDVGGGLTAETDLVTDVTASGFRSSQRDNGVLCASGWPDSADESR